MKTGLNPLKQNLNLPQLLRPCHKALNIEPKLLFLSKSVFLVFFYLNKKEISTSVEAFGIVIAEN